MIAQGICNSWKAEVMQGIHNAAHIYKIALYTSEAVLNKSTKVYSADHEVAGPGYTAGGIALGGMAAKVEGDTAILTWDTPISWPGASFSARGALIYNFSAARRAVVVLDFGQVVTATNGTFQVNLPAPTAASGLVRIN